MKLGNHNSTVTGSLEQAGGGQDRWLPVMRLAWIILAGLTTAIFIVAVPATFAQLQTVCAASPCFGWQLTAADAQALQRQNISMGFYAVYALALNVIFVLAFLGVAALIVWRRGQDRAAVLMALILTIFGAGDVLSLLSTVWGLPDVLWNALLGTSSALLFFLFPNGKFVPRWTRWVVVVLLARFIANPLYSEWSDTVGGIASVGTYVVGIGAQIYRYRRISTPVERQQTKWAVFGIVLVIMIQASLSLIGGFFPQTSTLSGGLVYLVINAAWPLSYTLIPISIGIAILRSQLYDIDIVVNRTLVYGTLTAALLLAYIGSVVLLQGILAATTGQRSNDLVIVVSTLLIAALFLPLRRGIQAFIDRRFFRRKYDAAKTLAAFSETVRDEVDLQRLTGRLVEVVEETLQPAQVSLWLRTPESKAK